jgi:DNA-binding LytR/AlgR family response regulator
MKAKSKLNCLIVDDEPVARNGMEEYVREVSFLNLVGKCDTALKAQPFLSEGTVDLMFLDIQMPRLSGIDFLKTLRQPPMVIFTTAFSEYALEGYSLDVIDYLMKPIAFERFLKAVQKASDFYEFRHPGQAAPLPADYFFIKCDSKFERIVFSNVLYVEALQNYVVIHTTEKKYITYLTLTSVEEQLPGDQFMKTHKSFLISFSKIKSIEGAEIVLVNGAKIPVSRNLKDEVMNRILGNNLLKR